MQRIWGFDLGTSSTGFAVVDIDEEHEAGTIVRLGARVFPEGVTEEKKQPRNQARRQARLIRRQVRRRRWRRVELRRRLVQVGLLPESELKPSPSSTVMASDPYSLRTSALTERLEPFEIGRALFHLHKRRGFVGSRKFGDTPKDPDKEKDEKKTSAEIADLRARMEGQHLGQFLHALPAGERKRGRHLDRQMITAEFDAIWAKQTEFHPQLLTDALQSELRRLIFFQRPTFWRLNTIGTCELEPGQTRCMKGDWHGQRFVMLQMLNSLRLAHGDRRPLTPEERDKALKALQDKAQVSFVSFRKKIGLERQQFNFELGGKKEALGNATEAKLRKVFGDEWERLPSRDLIRNEIADRLWQVEFRQVGNRRVEIRHAEDIANERAAFADLAEREYGVTREQAEKLSQIDLPQGWLRHSKAAILRMLPHLDAGMRYDEAKDAEYPPKPPAPAAGGFLPAPGDLRNPTVMRTLHELQKVANNLRRVHGLPDVIRVELARDLKLPKSRRLEIQSRNRKNEAARRKAKEELEKNGFPSPSRDQIEAFLLWEECGHICPYTGDTVSFDGLFKTGKFQVEHIIPRGRSFDDSFANKTICREDINKIKGDKTPWEAFGHTDEWPRMLKRLADMKQNGFPEAKIARFSLEDIPEAGSEEFCNRQLTDTAYISRAARDFLAQFGRPVEVTNGRATGSLRYLWGLETILSDAPGGKNRDDHRHHAVDALVVALTDRTAIKRLSTHFSREKRVRREEFRPSWPSLRTDAQRAVSGIVVSHRPQRKVSGALHEETRLGDTGREEVEGSVRYRYYVKRKPIAELSKNEIECIVDKAVREAVQSHVERHGGEPKTALKTPPSLPSGKLIKRVRIEVKAQPHTVVPLRADGAAFAKAGSNHHMFVFRGPDGKVGFRVVSMHEVKQRISRREPPVGGDLEPGAKFIMSLYAGDILHIHLDGAQTQYWKVKQLWDSGVVPIVPHNAARDIGLTRPSIGVLLKRGVRKVTVDPIGRVFPAND